MKDNKIHQLLFAAVAAAVRQLIMHTQTRWPHAAKKITQLSQLGTSVALNLLGFWREKFLFIYTLETRICNMYIINVRVYIALYTIW